MKAITYDRYGGPEVIQIQEQPQPKIQADQVLIRTHYLSINPYDWHYMRGKPYFMRLEHGLRKPKHTILGNDIYGVITEVGKQVNDLQIGDRVMAAAKLGGFAEYAAVAASRVIRVPEGLDGPNAAALVMAGVTAHAGVHEFGRVKQADRVLINGASGGVGHLAIQMAHATGANVTGICSRKNSAWVKSLGADEVIDYTQTNVSSLEDQFDVIIDVNGNLTLATYKQLLRKGGRVAVVGYNGMPDMMKKMWHQRFGSMDLKVVGVEENRSSMKPLVEMVEKGSITPHVSKIYSMEKFSEAIDHLEKGHAIGKLVVQIPVEGNTK